MTHAHDLHSQRYGLILRRRCIHCGYTVQEPWRESEEAADRRASARSGVNRSPAARRNQRLRRVGLRL